MSKNVTVKQEDVGSNPTGPANVSSGFAKIFMIALSYLERKLSEINRKLARLAEINRELREFPADVGGYNSAPTFFRSWIHENETDIQSLEAERSVWEVRKKDLLRSLEKGV